MGSSLLIWLISLIIVLLIVTMGIRIGGALARIQGLSFSRSLSLGAIALLIQLVLAGATWGIWSTVSRLSDTWQPILGIAGLVLGGALTFAIFKSMLQESTSKTLAVWTAHAGAAIIGLMAVGVVLTPGAIGAEHRAAQVRTTSDIKNSGAMVLSWMADLADGDLDLTYSDIDSQPLDVTSYDLISRSELLELLGPLPENPYNTPIPAEDGWGHSIEYRLARTASGEVRGICIRSPGRDGVFDDSIYSRGSFALTEADSDVVWADGVLVRWPE